MLGLFCFVDMTVHTIVPFQHIHNRRLGCNRTKTMSVVSSSISRDIDHMQIFKYYLESQNCDGRRTIQNELSTFYTEMFINYKKMYAF